MPVQDGVEKRVEDARFLAIRAHTFVGDSMPGFAQLLAAVNGDLAQQLGQYFFGSGSRTSSLARASSRSSSSSTQTEGRLKAWSLERVALVEPPRTPAAPPGNNACTRCRAAPGPG